MARLFGRSTKASNPASNAGQVSDAGGGAAGDKSKRANKAKTLSLLTGRQKLIVNITLSQFKVLLRAASINHMVFLRR
jgi:hypothetical protein